MDIYFLYCAGSIRRRALQSYAASALRGPCFLIFQCWNG
jgi:hypothetical protein